MAQHDPFHVGDNQKPQFWGAKQGLFINALANQYGQFTTDVTFQNLINQNTIFSIESTHNGSCTFGNSFVGAPFNNTSGIRFASGSITPYISNLYFLAFIKDPIFQNGAVTFFNFKQSKLEHTHINYDGSIFFSPFPNFNSYDIYIKRCKNINKIGFTDSGGITSTDNFYINNVFRLNYNQLFGINVFNTGVIHSLRIYTPILESKEVTDNYHAMSATDRSNLFIEYKMSQMSDFYVYDDRLFAKNTGSSGNTNQDGTGYDMELIGYNDNIPILQTIYT